MRKIKVVEAKDVKAFENKVNKMFSDPNLAITKTTYRTTDAKYSAIIEYEKGLR